MKALAVEGSAFWLIVSAVLLGATVTPTDLLLSVSTLVTVGIYLIIAYFVWTLKRWSYVVAVALALFTVVGGIVFSFSFGATSVFDALTANAFIIVPQLLVIFYSLRAYRDIGER